MRPIRSISDSFLVAEKAFVRYRTLSVFFVALIYLLVMDPGKTIPGLAYPLLAVGVAYSLIMWLFAPYRYFSQVKYFTFATIVDGSLIALFLLATGGVRSPFFFLYILSLIVSALRFSDTMIALITTLYALSYLSLIPWSGPVGDYWPDILARVGFLFLTSAIANVHYTQALRQIKTRLRAYRAMRRMGRTSRKNFAALEKSEKRHRDLVESLEVVIWESKSLSKSYSFVSLRAKSMFGFPLQRWLNDSDFWIHRIYPEDRGRVKAVYDSLESNPRDLDLEYRAITLDDHRIWIHERIHVVRDSKEQIQGFRGMIMDITKRKLVEDQIRHQSSHDTLTGLPNRALFVDRLDLAISQARQYNLQLAVLIFDMDRFRNIKDTLGYDFGYKILVAVARRIQSRLHEGEVLSRLGGDEFALLIPTIGKAQDASKKAQDILRVISAPIHIDEMELNVTITAGIGIFPSDGDDSETLLKNAAASLYDAKKRGRSQYRFYTPSMNAEAFRQLTLESSLRRALEREEFSLYYQPQVETRTGRITGVEALVRWSHPELGLLTPAEFIALAEETGLIIPIGEWVLRKACFQSKAWYDSGIEPVRLCVNISSLQFQQPGLSGTIEDILLETGLQPRYLGLEITESAAMQNVQRSIDLLEGLHSKGIQICLDDFGTGYSSLNYLKMLPIQLLKIDKSFIRDLADDPTDAAIATAVINLGHNMNMKVMAEGVETEKQLAFLEEHDCDQLQGFLFSRPVPARQLEPLLIRGILHQAERSSSTEGHDLA